MITPYFDSMFDNFGLWQHTDGKKPIKKEGYALDDATRGLIACLALKKTSKANILFDYIINSIDNDIIYGFADSKQKFIHSPASEDAMGQIVWALGYAASLGFRENEARKYIDQITPALFKMNSLRGYTYMLLGAIYVDDKLSDKVFWELVNRFKDVKESWFWPEDILTYGNGIVPYAILRYSIINQKKGNIKLGIQILNFLEKCCTHNRIRGPIGNDGWFSKTDSSPATYSQQPIDTAYMIWAWLCAYQISNNKTYLDNAKLWMQWFEGKNISNFTMYNKKTLQAFDGINKINSEHSNELGINRHSGAETNICLLLSLWMLKNNQTV